LTKKVGFNDVVDFTRQLSTMVVAGLSLPESLTILRNQATNKVFADVLLDVEHQIVGGGNLADALGRYPSILALRISPLSAPENLQEPSIKYLRDLLKPSNRSGISAVKYQVR